MHKMQRAKTEADGRILLKYLTEADDEARAEQMSQATQHFVYSETSPLFIAPYSRLFTFYNGFRLV